MGTTETTEETTMTMADYLVRLGGRRWQRGNHDRVYLPLSLCAGLINLRVSYYGSGNISGATLDGDEISNSRARQMVAALDGCYYDVVADRFVGTHYGVADAARDGYAGASAAR